MDKQFKVFNSEIKGIDEKEQTLTAIVSTGATDRMNESLDPNGADLKNFKKNPVVLFGHNYNQPPIGKAMWIKNTNEGIVAKVKFASTQFAQEIYTLYKEGIMRAFSVGFLPDKEAIEEGDGKKGPARTFRKWELLEFSAVPVPANPEAMTMAMSKGIVISENLKTLLNENKEIPMEKIIVKEGNSEEEIPDIAGDEKPAQEDGLDNPKKALDEVMLEIKVLQKKIEQLEKDNNTLKFEKHLIQQSTKQKTLSEMTVGEIRNIIEDVASGVIRKAQGKLN